MKVLVTAASKHGSTHEIGEAIAMQIQALGIPAEFCDLDSPLRHIEASAVVLGSPIYMGKWLPEAREFAEKHQSQLKALPVWLFSSGPLGDDPQAGLLERLPFGADQDRLLALDRAAGRRPPDEVAMRIGMPGKGNPILMNDDSSTTNA